MPSGPRSPGASATDATAPRCTGRNEATGPARVAPAVTKRRDHMDHWSDPVDALRLVHRPDPEAGGPPGT